MLDGSLIGGPALGSIVISTIVLSAIVILVAFSAFLPPPTSTPTRARTFIPCSSAGGGHLMFSFVQLQPRVENPA